MMGLGEGGRKRAAVMWHLGGLPSYKNLGEALEGVLARHLAAYRTHQAEESRATSLETVQPRQPLKVSPKAPLASPGEARGALGSIPARRDFT